MATSPPLTPTAEPPALVRGKVTYASLLTAGLAVPAALLFLLPPQALWAGVAVAALTAWAGRAARRPAVVQCALVWAVVYLFSVLVTRDPWPLPALAGLVLGAAVFAGRPATRVLVRENWLHLGHPNRTTWLLVVVTVIVSFGALLIWTAVTHPDTEAFRQDFGGVPLPLLPVLGVALAAINALAEESLFRGLLMSALGNVIDRGAVVIVIQGIAFGLLHATGFPGGPSGMALAAIYGMMLGVIRRQSGGMLGNWIAHLAADSLIFCIVVGLV
jgi:membrane protease YdiL (CAAX protease family)